MCWAVWTMGKMVRGTNEIMLYLKREWPHLLYANDTTRWNTFRIYVFVCLFFLLSIFFRLCCFVGSLLTFSWGKVYFDAVNWCLPKTRVFFPLLLLFHIIRRAFQAHVNTVNMNKHTRAINVVVSCFCSTEPLHGNLFEWWRERAFPLTWFFSSDFELMFNNRSVCYTRLFLSSSQRIEMVFKWFGNGQKKPSANTQFNNTNGLY